MGHLPQYVDDTFKSDSRSNPLAFALETLNTVVSFISVTALHELIASFGQTEDNSYAYLMCWGMFLGQSVEVMLSAYLW